MLRFHRTLDSNDSNKDTGNKQSLFEVHNKNQLISIPIKFLVNYLLVKKSLSESSKMLITLDDFCFFVGKPEIM